MNNDNNTEPVLYAVGARGYSAYEVAVQNGFVGTEQEWLDSLVGPEGQLGPEGKSAYEIAVENGYEGTEEDWVNAFLTPDGYYDKNEINEIISALVRKDEVIDSLYSEETQKPLSANQGKVLNENMLSINSKAETNKLNLNNEISDRTSADTQLQQQILGLASGSPLTASSVADMTDTTKTYVNTTDGNWYYYDGNDWQIGGVYQSTSYDTALKEMSDKGIIKFTDYTLEQGGIDTTGYNYNYPDSPQLRVNTCRTNGYLNLTAGKSYIFDNTLFSEYYMRIFVYNANNTIKYYGSYIDNKFVYEANVDEKVRFVVQVKNAYQTAEGRTPETVKSSMDISYSTDVLDNVEYLNSKYNDLYYSFDGGGIPLNNLDMERGGIHATTGAKYDYPAPQEELLRVNVARTSDYLDLTPGKKYVFTLLDNVKYMYRIYFYDTNDNYLRSSSYTTDPTVYLATNSEKLKLVILMEASYRTLEGTLPKVMEDNLLIYTYGTFNTQVNERLDALEDDIPEIKVSQNTINNQSKDLFCIMQYNVGGWYNGGGTIIPNDKYTKFYNIQKEIMNKYFPDIVCFEEYTTNMATGHPASSFIHEYYSNLESVAGGTTYDGKAIATNKNIFDTTYGNYVNTDGLTRNYLKTYTYMNGRKVAIISTHFAVSEPYKTNEADELLALLANEEYFIVCMDANAYGDSDLIKKFSDAGYNVLNTGQYHTYPATGSTIDNIITSHHFEFKYAIVDNTKENLDEGADHLPLIVYLSIVD